MEATIAHSRCREETVLLTVLSSFSCQGLEKFVLSWNALTAADTSATTTSLRSSQCTPLSHPETNVAFFNPHPWDAAKLSLQRILLKRGQCLASVFVVCFVTSLVSTFCSSVLSLTLSMVRCSVECPFCYSFCFVNRLTFFCLPHRKSLIAAACEKFSGTRGRQRESWF